MIKLGVNSVLFKAFPYRVAAEQLAKIGYDGVEISAIQGMCEHLCLDNWRSQAEELKAIREEYNLPYLAMEAATLDRERLLKAYEAAAEIGIPVVNVGPGGRSDDPESLKAQLEIIAARAEDAERFGASLCVKAHVGAAVYSTPTTLAMMDYVKSPAFGVDMDPSHIHRAGENPALALPAVLAKMKHIHIRDCKGDGPSPGAPVDQACGKGDIDLWGYFAAMVEQDYDGPVDLEVIGPELSLETAVQVAAESYGYMNAVLKKLGAR